MNVSDVFRVGYGLDRQGGVKPVRQRCSVSAGGGSAVGVMPRSGPCPDPRGGSGRRVRSGGPVSRWWDGSGQREGDRRLSGRLEGAVLQRRTELAPPRALRSAVAPAGQRRTRRQLSRARPGDVTENYAAAWSVQQLREPAQRVADRIEAFAQGGAGDSVVGVADP